MLLTNGVENFIINKLSLYFPCRGDTLSKSVWKLKNEQINIITPFPPALKNKF